MPRDPAPCELLPAVPGLAPAPDAPGAAPGASSDSGAFSGAAPPAAVAPDAADGWPATLGADEVGAPCVLPPRAAVCGFGGATAGDSKGASSDSGKSSGLTAAAFGAGAFAAGVRGVTSAARGGAVAGRVAGGEGRVAGLTAALLAAEETGAPGRDAAFIAARLGEARLGFVTDVAFLDGVAPRARAAPLANGRLVAGRLVGGIATSTSGMGTSSGLSGCARPGMSSGPNSAAVIASHRATRERAEDEVRRTAIACSISFMA